MDKDAKTFIKQEKELRKLQARENRIVKRYLIKLGKALKMLEEQENGK